MAQTQDATVVTSTTPELVDFIGRAQAVIDKDRIENYPNLPREILVVEDLGKLIRIWKQRNDGRSCWGFVAKINNTTKALGTIFAGDFLKCATWKAPAKTARGNIFKKNEQFTAYGANYLK